MALSDGYQVILENAVKANQKRGFYAQYPEHPKAYGEEAPNKGLEAYKNSLGKKFEELKQGSSDNWVGVEASPYENNPLGITYPSFSVQTLINKANQVRKSWKDTSITDRASILIDSLERIKNRFFEIGYATMHTTGQNFVMSFQASGPHANDRALEALALAYEELTRFPEKVSWEKPMGKFEVVLSKDFKAIPKGISLVIGCSTFPTWNSVPGIYASLMTGNPVIVKPHPGSILPIAIFVAEIQNALEAGGLDAGIVQLAVDSPENLITKDLAGHPDVKLIDYTGGSKFGDYLETIPNKTLFTEKAGVNSVILDSVKDLNAVMQNLAFSVSLYSGQMCTAPQNFFIPEGGISENGQNIPYEEVVNRFKDAVTGIINHPKMGAGTLGAIQNLNTAERAMDSINMNGRVILPPETVEHPKFANARVCSPAIIEVDANGSEFEQELFGPIVLIVKTRDSDHSIELASAMARNKGAITAAAYTVDPQTENKIIEAMEDVFAPVSINLTGFIWVNQHAAFSDFHGTGGNPAGNASFTNPGFVNNRFVWIGHRKVEG